MYVYIIRFADQRAIFTNVCNFKEMGHMVKKEVDVMYVHLVEMNL